MQIQKISLTCCVEIGLCCLYAITSLNIKKRNFVPCDTEMAEKYESNDDYIATEEIPLSTGVNFCNSLTIWLNKPHVVNRRLCGSRFDFIRILPKSELSQRIITNLVEISGFEFNGCDLLQLEKLGLKLTSNNDVRPSASALDSATLTDSVDSVDKLSNDEVAIFIRQLLPKQPERHDNLPELVIFDKCLMSCWFVPLKLPNVETKENTKNEIVYQFKYHEEPSRRITLSTSSSDFSLDSIRRISITWLTNFLLKKLARWSEQACLKTDLISLRLVPLEGYSKLYSDLKNKYGIPLAKIWPEKTSAQKYVFEDVAIATYLLLLWEADRKKKGLTRKQSFVDLGCGNGLLVHILASEGHPGFGVDVRKRNIWDFYGPETILKEMTITPSADSVFPQSDWLIGNHSDELTPWIPVMAARSSYSCNYFVLPCCFWDFNTRFDFHRSVGNGKDDVGKYRQYLDFVKTVGEKCGFIVEEDMLRIPSTKRVCFIGKDRTYDKSADTIVDKCRQMYISSRCDVTVPMEARNDKSDSDKNHDAPVSENFQSEKDNKWVSEFTPRSKTEITRNCVTISKKTKEQVIKLVFECLMNCDDCEVKSCFDGSSWRKGGKIKVADAVALFDSDLLKELKSECGGLQTLLRNSCHIFQVSGGFVQLRDFTLTNPFEGRKKKTSDKDLSDYVKTTLCWFYDNHPDGCPRDSVSCQYAHGMSELRPRPVKVKS